MLSSRFLRLYKLKTGIFQQKDGTQSDVTPFRKYFHIDSLNDFTCRLVIGYAALFAASLYFGFSYILKRIKPTVFSSFVTLQPVLAGVLAYLMLDESFGWHQSIGAVLVITGLFIVVTSFDFLAYFKSKQQQQGSTTNSVDTEPEVTRSAAVVESAEAKSS